MSDADADTAPVSITVSPLVPVSGKGDVNVDPPHARSISAQSISADISSKLLVRPFAIPSCSCPIRRCAIADSAPDQTTGSEHFTRPSAA